MRGDIRGWMAIGVIGLAVLAAILIGQQKPDSPEHSTNSDAANGASAVMLYASAMGHPTRQVTGTVLRGPSRATAPTRTGRSSTA